ncbi:hypothetical protein REH65_12910 [Saccharopolyspora sp. ID03-671]|uniref:hypothetical protein n=1 Tax=Saccharopolyspora sp. ID03-671 TaxID=3073066 RepID=UPI00324BE566
MHNPQHHPQLPPRAHELTWPPADPPAQSSTAALIVAALTTSGVSLGGFALLGAMCIKRGFEQGNHLAGALLLTAATLTITLGIGGSLLALLRGSRTGRILVTICCALYAISGTTTLLNGNIGSLIQLLIALPLATLWWLPTTTRALRSRRTPPPPATPYWTGGSFS